MVERPKLDPASDKAFLKVNTEWKHLYATLTPEDLRTSPELVEKMKRIRVEATVLFKKSWLERALPGGSERIERNFERIRELYDQAVEIQTQLLSREMTARGIAANGGLSDKFAESIQAKFQKGISDELTKMGEAVSVDLSSLTEGKSSGIFKRLQGGTIGVDAEKAFAMHTRLEEIAKNVPQGSEQWKLLRGLDAGLGRAIRADSLATEQVQLALAMEPILPKNVDNRQLRFLGAIGAALFATFGIVDAIKKKKMPTWPTFLWAGLTAVAVNPDMFKGKSMKDLEKAAAVGKPEMQNAIARYGITPDAAEELFQLDPAKKRKVIALMEKNDLKINVAQASQALGLDASSPVMAALSRAATDTERAQILRTFFAIDTKEAQETALMFMRNPPVM